MEDYLISVVMPVYNAEKYIEQAIESILEQTYNNLEILLVDDGSIDNSSVICDAYAQKDKRIRVIHKENGGPSSARNRGIDEAQGKYITFVDNDDLLHKRFIEILYGICEEYHCDIALTKSYAFLQEEELPGDEFEDIITVMNRRELSEKLLDMGWTGLAVTMAKLFKKELFNNIRFHEDRVIADDDSSIYLLYWKVEKAVLFHAPLYFYRSKRKGSITHSNYTLAWLTGVEAFRERMDFYDTRGEEILYAKAMRSYCRKMAENYFSLKRYLPNEKGVIKQLKWQNRKYSIRMFFIKGNSMKQKSSALLCAWLPFLWKMLYSKK